METIKWFSIEEKEYELYKAASGDYCVSVYTYTDRKDYNIGTYEEALEFILGDYEIKFEENEEDEAS